MRRGEIVNSRALTARHKIPELGRRASQGERQDSGSASTLQSRCAGRKRRARRHDVIYQDNYQVPNPCRVRHGKDPADILATRAEAQPRLRRRGPRSAQRSRLDARRERVSRPRQHRAQAARQQFRLVESSLPLARRMERHRDKDRCLARAAILEVPPRWRHQSAQPSTQTLAPLKLELQNRRSQVSPIEPVTARPIEVKRFVAAKRADRGLRVERPFRRKRQAALGAGRTVPGRKAFPAGPANTRQAGLVELLTA